ncbi:DNA methyltransferase [Frigoriflavimonas asaccharolytica]|uniref:site-specific DNA-methyltransferase (adenine-specific) n=1 Tax=Frigoriflavimonas asaccharolytica TaxID=2735899 RepID=A0A8J8GAN4_9FLAO|nr:site-specific DNA-methyltransferase [Frigoriflavimonas asaccharolytica]NRS92714.1 adenine-specific DNA-methyltransferase [Frigoriflavimonas asaccharolytica]
MNSFEHIKNILKEIEEFSDGTDVFKNKIVEAALRLDPKLLSVLMKDERSNSIFFQKVDDIFIFDKIKFQKFISNKEFLPDSFTSFKNKIGLTANGEYLTEAKEVVLDFPYKDCILEGGQTKEDQKRQEIFWNETLASEEIDRLFEPKALINWKKYDENGEHIVEECTINDNLILKGNNLIALHSLTKSHKGKIKLIYIDPPYNTGNDSFQYNDSFNRSTWLTFMKNRLEVAWNLLKSDGTFFIQVDDSEFAYLKVLCDDIFGKENFRETIVLKSSTESGVNAINVKRGERLFKVKEYILFYSKSKSFRFKPFYTKAEFNLNYKYEVINKDGTYTVEDISKKFKEKFTHLDISSTEKDLLTKKAFENYALQNSENIYSLEKNIKKAGEKFKNFALANKSKGIVEAYENSLKKIVLIYDGGVFVPLQERVIIEENKKYFGVLASDLWVDIGTTPSSEGGVKFSNGKKPEKLLQRIIAMTTDANDIVLDYHLGSGTTAAVAHKMGRRYIGIEQMDYGENDSVVRLQNVISGDTTGISKNVNWIGGGNFIYAELAKHNAQYIAKIQAANNGNDIEKIRKSILEDSSRNYKISKTSFEENIPLFEDLTLDQQKIVLINLLDKNELYINYSEIEDQTYNISKEIVKINQQFYNSK